MLFHTCKPNDPDYPKLWMGTYLDMKPSGFNMNYYFYWPRNIIAFKEDSIISKSFYIHPHPNIQEINSYKFYRNENISIQIPDRRPDTICYEITSDSIIANHKLTKYRIVYKPFMKFGAIENDSLFLEYLTSSTFEMSNSRRIEFNETWGTLITSDSENYICSKGNWMVDSYENETFILSYDIGHDFNNVFHLKAIDEEGFTVVSHGRHDQEIRFKKLAPQINFDINHLIGEWVEHHDIPPPPLPPFIEDPNIEYLPDEHLEITDSTIIKKVFHKRDTIRWGTNREQDLILLYRFSDQWKIISLNDNELVIARRSRYYNRDIERKKFLKKK